MNERIKKVTTIVKEKWTGFSRAVKILIVAVPIALIAIIIVLVNLLNHKDDAVLFSGLNTTEISQISAAISELGVTDVKISNDEIIVPEDQADYLRMQLSVQGYPKSSTNYDIWNDGIDLWSTESDKREVARQQREARIEATLRQLDAVQSATVNLEIPKTRDYVITEKEETPRCSITLKLKEDEGLTNAEVRAIFDMVSKSVDGLTYENISVIDTYGRPYEWISKEQEEAEGKDASGVPIAKKRFLFQREMENTLLSNLESMLTKMYGKNGYAINVAAILNYDAENVEKVHYYPDGDTHEGVLERSNKIETNIGNANVYGVVGTTPNADQSPDYPTLNGVEDGQRYYYNQDENQYDVSYIKNLIQKDGYSIDKLSVGVAINTTNMTQADREAVASMVASAAGTTVENVSVYNTAFVPSTDFNPSGTGLDIITRPVDPYRNMLLFLVIALGIILISLLIISLCMSRSRKKKIRRRQEQALVAAQAAAAADVYGNGGADNEMPQEVDFNIASLTEEAGKESRETILKREIADFARTSPEIVASIIRNMMREES